MKKLNRRVFIGSSAVGIPAVVAASQSESSETGAAVSGVTGYNYRLPKFKKGATLLFQGDSITDMKWGRNQSDRNHYLGHSYVYLIASRLHTDMPEAELNFLNRGVSGNTVPNLQARWQNDALDLNPDVLSILIGVNDVGRALRSASSVDIAAYETGYRSLLEQSRKKNPELKIVLLEPFILPLSKDGQEKRQGWREEVERMRPVVARLAADFQAVLIKTQDIFDEAARRVDPTHWIWDGVHPLPQGHELIARNWIESVAKAWN